jgi:hypothetical protein
MTFACSKSSLQVAFLKKYASADNFLSCLIVYNILSMKKAVYFFAFIWNKFAKGIRSKKRSHQDPLSDAIGFPHSGKHTMVEDYEMAAFHQQA